ncbi:MAG: stalk domain-containing protein [Clostridiales bacterium]|nr:stalk domain-containing protein [Clostridiales bacterium]
MAVLFFLLAFAAPGLVFGDTVNESDIAPTLLSAIKDVTGLNPVFPIQSDHAFFKADALDLRSKSITSLKGIRFFSELTSLNVDYNKLSTLRGIVFPDNIRTLSIAHNSIITLADVHWPARMRSLDLRNNRLSSPLGVSFPSGVSSIVLDNNFLTSKAIDIPRDCRISLAGNFIYEANAIRPAALVVSGIRSISLSPGEQKPIPFMSITSSANPNNQVPSHMVTAQLIGGAESPVQLRREEYRFLISAESAGSDFLMISLNLSTYQINQYENMSQTFYKTSVPITVWQSAENRPGAASDNNGDNALLTALSGRSSNAVSDMTRYANGAATFSPGLLAQLASQNQKLILTHDFGNLTLDPKNLQYIADQASVSSDASVQISLNIYDYRLSGITPSRFSDRQIQILSYRDFAFSVQLHLPGEELSDMELGAPVTAVHYLQNQGFSAWDLAHLTAFKDNTSSLDLLGGALNAANTSFSYILSGTGRYGLGTRSASVRWLDMAINSTQILRWDGSVGIINPAPLLYRGATLAPLRSIFEELGAAVVWHGQNRSATITYNGKVLYITEGQTIGGSDQAPYMFQDRMMVPLSAITTEIGATLLSWDQDGRIRIIY